ncbi:Coiled-coil domain-containing protein 81 [Batrachochytrium dendrobatidis]|nr:Coiled-coil domain-containing protein 81 [Batrachochytrium dendrobatidis]KAK5670466.1 Coiled-coil domain-containing protein 81 [Batrachochytrium dendrobatidis]
MDILDLDDVIKVVCESISKNKRFSELSHLELCDLWKGMSRYITGQLIIKKSTNIPGIGGFFIKKNIESPGYHVYFSPSRSWNKITGLRLNQIASTGSCVAESMNFSLVAQLTGFQRDLIEAGLKDIVHGLFKVLKRGSTVNLAFGQLGRMSMQSHSIKFRFSQGILKTLNDDKTESHLNSTCSPHQNLNAMASGSQPKLEPILPGRHSPTETRSLDPSSNSLVQSTLPLSSQVDTSENNATSMLSGTSRPQSDLPEASKLRTLEMTTVNEASQPVNAGIAAANTLSIETPSSYDNLAGKSEYPINGAINAHNQQTESCDNETFPNTDISAATDELDEAACKLKKLEELIDKTFSIDSRNVLTHTHSHSGNRLWTNHKCPICRTKQISFEKNRDIQRQTEQEHDRMLLHLSLELDKDFIKTKKDAERTKLKNAISTAHYNHLKAMEKRQEFYQRVTLPVGNLFENREVKRDPILLQQTLALDLKQQLESKQARLLDLHAQQELEDRISNDTLIKEIKAAELQNHLEKSKRCMAQQKALSEQIRLRQSDKDPLENVVFDNPFARSESLMVLYQKEKAKQLYQEQMAIVRQRREYAHKVTEIEKRHSLDRLAISRKELEKDLQSIKQGKVFARKGLESYWADQVLWKRKLSVELEHNS